MSFVRNIVIHHEKSCASVISIPCNALAYCGRCNRCFCWWFLCSLDGLLKGAVCLVLLSWQILLPSGLCVLLTAVSYSIMTTIPLTTFGIHVILKGHTLNIAQILIAFEGVRWAPSSAHLCPGRTAYSARSNPWSKVSRSCPIQPATISQLQHWQTFASEVQI
jgi:hypothetical protein